ncbi:MULTISPECIES: hypothetical protein [Yersinia]|nr:MULTISPECIES: hypothetical protein [Yersinia]
MQNFLNEDLIDQMIITRFPILLGGGRPHARCLDQVILSL